MITDMSVTAKSRFYEKYNTVINGNVTTVFHRLHSILITF